MKIFDKIEILEDKLESFGMKFFILFGLGAWAVIFLIQGLDFSLHFLSITVPDHPTGLPSRPATISKLQWYHILTILFIICFYSFIILNSIILSFFDKKEKIWGKIYFICLLIGYVIMRYGVLFSNTNLKNILQIGFWIVALISLILASSFERDFLDRIGNSKGQGMGYKKRREEEEEDDETTSFYDSLGSDMDIG